MTDTMLDGLDLRGDSLTESALRRSVETTIRAISDDGLLEPRHTALCQLALELADAVAAGARAGRASAAAMAAAQLRETLLALPAPPERNAQQSFEEFVESLRATPA